MQLNSLTEEVAENYSNPLNLVSWHRTKYNPNESENRIRVENRISLSKASNVPFM
jgi:hypothetical protein